MTRINHEHSWGEGICFECGMHQSEYIDSLEDALKEANYAYWHRKAVKEGERADVAERELAALRDSIAKAPRALFGRDSEGVIHPEDSALFNYSQNVVLCALVPIPDAEPPSSGVEERWTSEDPDYVDDDPEPGGEA